MQSAFVEGVRNLILGVELIGVGVTLAGFVVSTVEWLRGLGRVEAHAAQFAYRRRSVRAPILDLEFLVAAVTIDYILSSLLMLGLIVLTRCFLVFALPLETEGRLPWKQAEAQRRASGTRSD